MRDLALIALVLGMIPLVFKRPFYGLLLWVLFSIMNPHRLAYGWAYEFQFALIIAVITLLSFLVNTKKLYPFPVNGVTLSLLLFLFWINVSPLFSFHPDGEFESWLRVIKIQAMVLIAFYLVGNRDELQKLTWVLAISIGFYGVKGGLFTVLTGGSYKVWGPDGTFIADNNSLALAIIMVVPLFRYLQLHSSNRWVSRGCALAMLLCVAAAVGSYSRGALVGLAAMALFLWLKSPNKALLGVVGTVVGIIILFTMPEDWLGRMNSIGTYDEDASAQGRINAWWMAWNLALSRIPIGGGFNVYMPDVFGRFAPNPLDIHAAHSIYFQVLGEHGFMGLFLFLAVFIAAWRSGNWTIARVKNLPQLRWAQDLAAMLQVSLIGYAVGGAFLSLTWYDFPYYVAAMLAITRIVVQREIKTVSSPVTVADGRSGNAATGVLGFKR